MDPSATVSVMVPDDSDLMVTEEVVGEAETEVAVGQATAVHPLKPLKKSKILVTISEDLSYALTIDGDTMAAVMDSIATDEYMKNEWHSWHRFVSNPNQFFVYIFDHDFGEYVRYRPDTPVRHLSKLKIRNKFYVNQTGCKSSYQPMSSRSPLIDDMIEADIEPTDTLTSDQADEPKASDLWSGPPLTPTHTPRTAVSSHSADIINHDYHHNYHLSSPSAPTSVPASHPISAPPKESDSEPDPDLTALPLLEPQPEPHSQPHTKHNSSHTSKATTNTNANKLVTNSSKAKSNGSETAETDSLSGDLLADALTGPSFEWTQEQTFALLDECKQLAKHLAPKNVAEVNASVWEELATKMNDKGSDNSSLIHQ